MSKLIPLAFACALLFSTVSGLVFNGANCDTVYSSSFPVSSADVNACQQGILLPPGIGVFSLTEGFVQVAYTVYRCDFSFRGAFGIPGKDTALVAQAGVALNDSTFYDLGSSTNSARLAAAVQSAGFNLFFGPNIQENIGATTATASRTNFLPRGPDFAITGSNLASFPFAPGNFTFVEYSNSVVQGPRVSLYNHFIPAGNALASATCSVVFDGATLSCGIVVFPNRDDTFSVRVQSTGPLRVSHCT